MVSLKEFSDVTTMTNGYTLGGLTSLPSRCIKCLNKESLLHPSLLEFAGMPPCSDTRSSCGCCCMIGIFSTRKDFICHPTTVSFVIHTLKKPHSMCFGTATLPSVAANQFLGIETEESPFMMRSPF